MKGIVREAEGEHIAIIDALAAVDSWAHDSVRYLTDQPGGARKSVRLICEARDCRRGLLLAPIVRRIVKEVAIAPLFVSACAPQWRHEIEF